MTEVFKANIRDIDDIIGVERDAFPLAPWTEETFREAFSHEYDHLIVVRIDSRTAGYAWLRVTDCAELMRIAVESGSRRKGIGSLLLSAVVRTAVEAGAGFVLLEVRAKDASAVGLYTKAGFCTISVRKGYYSAPRDDALIMRYIC